MESLEHQLNQQFLQNKIAPNFAQKLFDFSIPGGKLCFQSLVVKCVFESGRILLKHSPDALETSSRQTKIEINEQINEQYHRIPSCAACYSFVVVYP